MTKGESHDKVRRRIAVADYNVCRHCGKPEGRVTHTYETTRRMKCRACGKPYELERHDVPVNETDIPIILPGAASTPAA